MANSRKKKSRNKKFVPFNFDQCTSNDTPSSQASQPQNESKTNRSNGGHGQSGVFPMPNLLPTQSAPSTYGDSCWGQVTNPARISEVQGSSNLVSGSISPEQPRLDQTTDQLSKMMKYKQELGKISNFVKVFGGKNIKEPGLQVNSVNVIQTYLKFTEGGKSTCEGPIVPTATSSKSPDLLAFVPDTQQGYDSQVVDVVSHFPTSSLNIEPLSSVSSWNDLSRCDGLTGSARTSVRNNKDKPRENPLAFSSSPDYKFLEEVDSFIESSRQNSAFVSRTSTSGYLGSALQGESSTGYLGSALQGESSTGYLGSALQGESSTGYLGSSLKGGIPIGYLGEGLQGESPRGYLGNALQRESSTGYLGSALQGESSTGYLGSSLQGESSTGYLGSSLQGEIPSVYLGGGLQEVNTSGYLGSVLQGSPRGYLVGGLQEEGPIGYLGGGLKGEGHSGYLGSTSQERSPSNCSFLSKTETMTREDFNRSLKGSTGVNGGRISQIEYEKKNAMRTSVLKNSPPKCGTCILGHAGENQVPIFGMFSGCADHKTKKLQLTKPAGNESETEEPEEDLTIPESEWHKYLPMSVIKEIM